MNRSPLLGTTEGVFDSLQVRNPPHSGTLVDIASLMGSGGSGTYDDTQVPWAIYQLKPGAFTNMGGVDCVIAFKGTDDKARGGVYTEAQYLKCVTRCP